MANRGITVAEMKAMLENLADKVTEEGAELYQDISSKVDEMANASSKRASELAEELGPKLARLRATVSEEGAEVIALMEIRLDMIKAEIMGEIAEFREVGLVAWVKSNPMTAAGIVVVLVAILAMVGASVQ